MHEEEGVEVVFGTIKYTWKESMMKLDFRVKSLITSNRHLHYAFLRFIIPLFENC